MRKIIALAFLATMMVGCDKKNPDGTHEPCSYKVYIIDSCEYVGLCEGLRTDYLAHKGNCRFCAERNKRMIREQVDSILLEIFD